MMVKGMAANLYGTMQLIWGAHPPRMRFDAPRVELFAMGTLHPIVRPSRPHHWRTRRPPARAGARVLPISNCIVPAKSVSRLSPVGILLRSVLPLQSLHRRTHVTHRKRHARVPGGAAVRVAAGGLMAYGVQQGRKAVNYSEWAAYPAERQQTLLVASCQDVSEGKMPGAYTLLHPETRLSAQDVETICTAASTADGAPLH